MKITLPLLRYNYILRVQRKYLGASALAKKPNLGEDWLRGNDLADGKPSLETLWDILVDIISYEFNLGRWAIGRNGRP